jgi:hypothetical protein
MVDPLEDEFEGHYTVHSCLEKVLAIEARRTGKTPEAVRMSQDFYRYLMVDEMPRLPQAGYGYPPIGFTEVYMALSVGQVRILPDRNVSRNDVFEIDYYDD